MLDAVADDVDRAAAAQALAEGVGLGSYRFLRYKSDPKPSQLSKVVVVTRGGARIRAALDRGTRVAEAVTWARDLVNEPAAGKSPADIVALARSLARGAGLKVKVFSGEQLVRERMGGVLGVGEGSDRPPQFLRLEYAPAGARGNSGVRRQGRGVRLRRPVVEDRGRHGDHEDRHVGRGRGDRGDGRAARPRRENER